MEHPKDDRIEIWNDIALIADDTHFTKWVKEHGSLITDPHHVAIAAKYIRKGDIVIDGGANIGTFTKAFADLVGGEGLVIAFEPNPLAYECLKYNFSDYPNKWVYLLNSALGSTQGFCEINDNDKNHGTAYVSNLSKNDGGSNIRIVAIDKFTTPFINTKADGTISFIKLDIEGFELSALQGSVETIKRFQPVFDIEINDATLARNGVTPNDVYQFMHDLGYTITELIGEAPQVDVIFLPPNYQPRA